MCSGGAGFVVAEVGIGGRPTRLEGAGLGVIVRGPGAGSVCTGVADVCCGKVPGPCDFTSFLSSFCARSLFVTEIGDQKRVTDLSSSIFSGLGGF